MPLRYHLPSTSWPSALRPIFGKRSVLLPRWSPSTPLLLQLEEPEVAAGTSDGQQQHAAHACRRSVRVVGAQAELRGVRAGPRDGRHRARRVAAARTRARLRRRCTHANTQTLINKPYNSKQVRSYNDKWS